MMETTISSFNFSGGAPFAAAAAAASESSLLDAPDEAVTQLYMWLPSGGAGNIAGSSGAFGGASGGPSSGLAKAVPGLSGIRRRLPGSASSSSFSGAPISAGADPFAPQDSSYGGDSNPTYTPRSKRESIIANTRLDPFGAAVSLRNVRPSGLVAAAGSSSSRSSSGSLTATRIHAYDTEGLGSIPGPAVAGAGAPLTDLDLVGSPAAPATASGLSGALFGGHHRGQGSWRKVTVLFKQHGVCSIYSEDKALLHSTLISDLSTAEIRKVDDSVFLRSNVLAISSRVSTLARSTGNVAIGRVSSVGSDASWSPAIQRMRSSSSSIGLSSSKGSGSSASSRSRTSSSSHPEPIFLAFPSRTKLVRWLKALQAYATPEIYTCSPRLFNPSASGAAPDLPKVHRIDRSIKISVIEARSATSDNHAHQSGGLTNMFLPSSMRKRSLGGFDGHDEPRLSGSVSSGSIVGRTISRKSSSTTNNSDVIRRSSQSSSGTHRSDPISVHVLPLPSSSAAGMPGTIMGSAGASPRSPALAPRRRSLLNPRGSGDAAAPDSPIKLRAPASTSNAAGPLEPGKVPRARNAADFVSTFASPSTSSSSQSTPSEPPREPSMATSPIAPRGLDSIGRRVSESSSAFDSGPLTGSSTASAWTGWTAAGGMSPPHSSYVAPSRKDSVHSVFSSGSSDSSWCSCRILVNGVMLARTSFKPSQEGLVWMEKFKLESLPALRSCQVEVMQHTSGKGGTIKQTVIGLVTLPVDTIQRGEEVEGWFPVWSVPEEPIVSYAFDQASKEMLCSNQEVVAELKLSINISELVVMPSVRYAAMEKALCGDGRAQIITQLAATAGEDTLLTSVVKYAFARGQIVPLLADLARVESDKLGSDPDQDLLFRGNTALSRSLDKFQQLCCGPWLEASIGDYVQHICSDELAIDVDELLACSRPPHRGFAVGEDAGSGLPPRPACVDQFQDLIVKIWESIYRHRHQCPSELRDVLYHVRSLVNARFAANGAGSGIQGVGAFVFLRLICPAVTSPQLFGLISAPAPSQRSKLLLLVAKVFLALANKKLEFDKDKEPLLCTLNPFLREQASAYDDYITFVSTRDISPGSTSRQPRSTAVTPDEAMVQHFQAERTASTMPLESEGLLGNDQALERSLLLAGLSATVARTFGDLAKEHSRDVLASLARQQQANDASFCDFVAACTHVDVQASTLFELTSLGLCDLKADPFLARPQPSVVSSVVTRKESATAAPAGKSNRMFARSRSTTLSSGSSHARGPSRPSREDLPTQSTLPSSDHASFSNSTIITSQRHSHDSSRTSPSTVAAGLDSPRSATTVQRKKKWWRI